MNIFYLSKDPVQAAIDCCDTHVNKMPTETVQMLVSAAQRHDANPQVITKAGTIHKGGYKNHPCTRWAGDTRLNFYWLWQHGMALCDEFVHRYGHEHFARGQLDTLFHYMPFIPSGPFTPPPQAMPDECKHEDTVVAYHNCIHYKVRMKPKDFVWEKGRPAPAWFNKSEI